MVLRSACNARVREGGTAAPKTGKRAAHRTVNDRMITNPTTLHIVRNNRDGIGFIPPAICLNRITMGLHRRAQAIRSQMPPRQPRKRLPVVPKRLPQTGAAKQHSNACPIHHVNAPHVTATHLHPHQLRKTG
jgi:hypothetical protein